MKTRQYDLEELLAYAQRGDSVPSIIETLGLTISERQVYRLIEKHLGRRPTRETISRPDVVRDRVVAYMESQGLNRYYCTVCERRWLEPGFIRALNRSPSLDVLVFVCRHCSGPADR